MKSVAVIDSGIGGVSVLNELRPILPHTSFIYYADNANCPYGGKSREEIVELTLRVVELVVEQGARMVVVACNTMTTAAIDILRSRWTEIDFVGMEPAIKPALEGSKSGVVGVLATKATLSGELYHNTKERYAEGRSVVEVAGEGLVELVESGREGSAECEKLVQNYLGEMIERGADTVVLGCSHFPFLIPTIERVMERMGVTLTIINPAPAVAARARYIAQERGMEGDPAIPGSVRYLSSGEPLSPNLFL